MNDVMVIWIRVGENYNFYDPDIEIGAKYKPLKLGAKFKPEKPLKKEEKKWKCKST